MTVPEPTTHRSRLDFGLLATLALCLLTLWPLLYRPGLPNGTDTLYHVYRVAEMDRAWSHGVLMPQWAETFYFGYGSPVFHYYASFTYYVTSTLMRLLSIDPVNALRLLTLLSMLLAGGGMYLFMRGETGRLAGVIAGVVYVYSPYFLFTEPYTRGAYPELLALALFPLVMWRYSRLLRHGGGRALVLAAFGSGLLIITHNLMALVLTGLLAAWIGWQALSGFLKSTLPNTDLTPQPPLRSREGEQNRLPRFFESPRQSGEGIRGEVNMSLEIGRARWAGLALVAGIGLATYFWLPVIAEQGAVRLGNLTAVAQLDYEHFFVPLRDLLAFSPRPDAGAINGLLHQLNLGVAQWALALAGVVGTLAMLYGHDAPCQKTLTSNPSPSGRGALSVTY